MNRRLALTVLVAGFVAATSPVWAATGDNPSFTPDPATPGATASFSGLITSSSFAIGGGTCVVTTSPEPVALAYACGYDSKGQVSGWVVVPSGWTSSAISLGMCGPPGCTDAIEQDVANWYLEGTLGVTTPPPRITVPRVVCFDVSTARVTLQRAGLDVTEGRSTFIVGSQSPVPGATVTAVTTASLYPARVPAVVGLSYASASALVARACGSPIASGDTSGTVVTQSPSASGLVPSDRRILLVLSAAPSSPPSSPPSSLPSSPPSSPPPPPPPPPSPPSPSPPSPSPHRAWWPLALTGASLMAVAGVAAGAYQWRVHHSWDVRVGEPALVLVWEPDVPGRLRPSLIVRRHPTTYRLEEPT